MVKKFNEFIEESYDETISAEDTPECLLKIVEFINSINLNLNNTSDGRVGSIHDEDDVINCLKESEEFIVSEKEMDSYDNDKIYIVKPRIREWFDIEVIYNNNHYYVNIKSSNLTTFDNIGSVSSLMFGLFGIKKSMKNLSKADMYSELFKEYNKHEENGYDDIKNSDYYFLVINKRQTSKCFITSLNRINKNSIRPNGSNLPFQCKWIRNSKKILLDKHHICDIIIETVFNSLIKTIEIFEKEPIKKYMNKHNKLNIPDITNPKLW